MAINANRLLAGAIWQQIVGEEQDEQVYQDCTDGNKLLPGSNLVYGLLNILVMFLYHSLESNQHGVVLCHDVDICYIL